jgi:uncharacterized protein YggU (UPF0235/DUF167 family)
MIPIDHTDKGAAFAVKVHPHARKNAITGEVGDALKISLTAPPVNDKAKPGLHRIPRKTFEGATLFRYHCVRPEQSKQSHSRSGHVGRRS